MRRAMASAALLSFAEFIGERVSPLDIPTKPAALRLAELTFAQLTSTAVYPRSPVQVHQICESAEKSMRYLCNNDPRQLFPNFVERFVAGEAAAALVAIYGSEFNDMASVERRFARFTR